MGKLVHGHSVTFRCQMGTMSNGSIKVGSIDMAPDPSQYLILSHKKSQKVDMFGSLSSSVSVTLLSSNTKSPNLRMKWGT